VTIDNCLMLQHDIGDKQWDELMRVGGISVYRHVCIAMHRYCDARFNCVSSVGHIDVLW